jgi:PAS domain S-box-containing protein
MTWFGSKAMKDQKRQTLTAQIQNKVIPKVLLATMLLTYIIATTFFVAGQNQLRQQHQLDIEKLTNSIEISIQNLNTTISGLAKNDLLINGLIDYQMRDEYLPLFFQGLTLVRDQQASAALFDFSGEPILSNNWKNLPDYISDGSWQETVLKQSKSFIYLDASGLTIIEPIVMSEQSEGALALYVASIDSLLSWPESDINKYIFDSENNLLFATTKNNNISQLADVETLSGYVHKSKWGDFQVVSQEPYSLAYRHLVWLIPILIVAVAGTLLGSAFGVRHAAKQAAKTLRILHQSLREQMDKNTSQGNSVEIIKEEHANEPIELSDIRTSYDDLLEQVLSLSLSNTKISNVLNSLRELLLVADSNGQKVLANTASEQFFLSEAEQQKIVAQATYGLSDQNAFAFTSTHVRNASNHTIAWTAVNLFNSHQEKSGTIVTGEDVTEKMLLEAKANLRQKAVDVSSAAIFIADVSIDTKPLVYINQAFTDVTAYSPEQAIGKSYTFLKGEESEPELLQKLHDAIASHSPIELTLTNYKKDGIPFINRLSLTPVFESDNSVKYYVGVIRDISVEQKSAKYLEEAKREAERTAAAQARFFASMNHELRTPLHGINGMLNALTSTALNKEQKRYVELAGLSSNNLLTIVNDVLVYAKAESGELTLKAETIDIKKFLVDLKEAYTLQCEQQQLAFILLDNIDESLWLSIDKVRLRQVLDNLFNNALKFTKIGKITLSLEASQIENEQVLLKFSLIDTGEGIDNQQIEHVFKRFMQARSSNRDIDRGTGLGLAICKQIVTLMGGEISVQSELGIGSSFVFSARAKIAGEQKSASDALTMRNALGSYKPAVLVVEDNEINQEVVLANLKGARTIVANNGLEALRILESAKIKFDLILMDCQMPEMDGYTASTLIRDGQAGEHYRDIPIIALTAYVSSEDQEKCKAAGMNDFLGKPFNPVELLHKVNQWGQR